MPLAWPTPDEDVARILASYPSALFGPPNDGQDGPNLHAIFWSEACADWQRAGLVLLARAGIEEVPPNFDARELAQTAAAWRAELREHLIGSEPPAAERDALDNAATGAARFLPILDRLIKHTLDEGSRIESSMFTVHWTPERLDALRRELAALREDATSAETRETMRRTHLLPAGKPEDGWSARESFYGYNLPSLYETMFGRAFTWTKGKPDLGEPPSEGVRFACVIASEVLDKDVTAENVVKMGQAFRKAAGGNRAPK